MEQSSTVKFYSIGEVSKMVGEAPSTLRYWEKEFEQAKPLTTDFGRRVYTEEKIEIIKKIKTLLHEEGLTIKGAKNFLAKSLNEPNFTGNIENANNQTGSTELKEVKDKLNDLLSYIRKGKKN